MKQCRRCKMFKDNSEFASYQRAPDGLQYWCRQCQTDYSRTDKRKAAMKAYTQSEQGRLNRRKRQCEFLKTKKGKEYRSQKGKRHTKKDPIGQKAKAAVYRAVKQGLLPCISTQKCSRCDNQAQHYHHWSYERNHWLDVIPLCFDCHMKEHNPLISSQGQLYLFRLHYE